MYEYLLSVIMPVYNSALYLEEAIDSIIDQTLGIDKIQLILVDDGSTDGSAEIIKKYATMYPKSIVSVSKENGGVSSARNAGLAHVKGKYVTFPDPDDTISKNSYKDAIDFFEKHYDETNVVSFPIHFFGDGEGAHPLNAKFDNGARIIDLEKENEFQLHITSSIIKAEASDEIHFKSSLVASEDAEVLLKLLIDKPYLGVVPSACYNYRKRAGSLISTATGKKGWYSDHLIEYFESVINYARSRRDSIPCFIQSAIMYDLSWKLAQREAPLSEKEISTFKTRFFDIIRTLDKSVILDCKNLDITTKQYLLTKTHTPVNPSDYRYTLEFIDTCGDKFKISARISYPVGYGEPLEGIAFVSGNQISVPLEYEEKSIFLGEVIAKRALFSIEIPKEGASVYFAMRVNGEIVIASSLDFGRFFPLENKYSTSFASLDNMIISYEEGALIIDEASKKKLKRHEKSFLQELWKSNAFAERKAVIARVLAKIFGRFKRKPLWLISDRLSVAGDNGEALFVHLCSTKFKDAKFVYAIRKGSDYKRLKKIGSVVDRASLKYKIMHLVADVIISSQAEDAVIDPFDYYGQPYKDILAKKPFVFLQHGVIKDDLSAWLNKYNKNIKGFVCSAQAEYDSILKAKAYHYTENELWLTGLARFDRLENKREKIITVMPTWRRYLVNKINIATGEWNKSSQIENSEYISFWNTFLSDKRIENALLESGYKILLVPHPNMRKSIDLIHTSPLVSLDTSTSYRELYKISALLITDYSSTAFDMAYLEKPIIYAQFDKEQFFSGAHTYKRGYFDYEKNGFGKVVYTLDGLVDSVLQCIENDCAQEPLYRDRINDFFAYRDKNSCARIVQKIIDLGAKNDNSK